MRVVPGHAALHLGEIGILALGREDLPALFGGLDKHLERLAARFNDPNSTEIGSAAIQIIDL